MNPALFLVQSTEGVSYKVTEKRNEEGVPTSLDPSEPTEWITYYTVPLGSLPRIAPRKEVELTRPMSPLLRFVNFKELTRPMSPLLRKRCGSLWTDQTTHFRENGQVYYLWPDY